MLRVTIELIPGGYEESKRVIGIAEIVNVGGDRDVADYDIHFLDITERLEHASTASVRGHIRARGFWALLARVARAHGRAR